MRAACSAARRAVQARRHSTFLLRQATARYDAERARRDRAGRPARSHAAPSMDGAGPVATPSRSTPTLRPDGSHRLFTRHTGRCRCRRCRRRRLMQVLAQMVDLGAATRGVFGCRTSIIPRVTAPPTTFGPSTSSRSFLIACWCAEARAPSRPLCCQPWP